MAEDRAATFLQMIRRANHGRLKVYLGYGPGVGKTYQMLTEAHRLKADGIDVVVGVVETHNRSETAKLLEGLEIIPRRKIEYHNITLEEMDLDQLLARKPQVALVDELAHTNAPDSRNPKRYQDVQELLAAGIHVISTLNVQHLESLYNTVEQLLGVKVRERVPDSVLAEADEVVNIDLSADDLQRRLRQGKIYAKDRVASAMENFFASSNLEHLRELTLREVASQLDIKRRQIKSSVEVDGSGSEQVMVCLSSRGPDSARLLRYGSRLAGRLNRNWYAVYVQTPNEDPTVIDARTQRLLADTLTLANQLGATVFTFKGQDVADTILRFAHEYRVANIVIGRPHPIPLWRRLTGRRSVAEQLIHRSRGVSVLVVDTQTDETVSAEPQAPAPPPPRMQLVGLLTPDHILIRHEPVTREAIFRDLVIAATSADKLDPEQIVAKLWEREQAGSTFLNDGVALPHARIDGLSSPRVALALTRSGVLDTSTENPIQAVFLLLTPTANASIHLRLLAQAAQFLQNRQLRRRLLQVDSPLEALDEIRAWDTPPVGHATATAQ
jgi:two-component system sensor histidine kinase KdpD